MEKNDLIGGPKGGLKVHTMDGGSPRLGPGTGIHSTHNITEIPDPMEDECKRIARETCIKVGLIATPKFSKPEECKIYLVYRKPLSDPKKAFPWEDKYCICICKNNTWVPVTTPWVENGAPIEDEDQYMDLDNVFEAPEPEPTLHDAVVNEDSTSGIQEYIAKKYDEEEAAQKAEEERARKYREEHHIPEVHAMPLDPNPERDELNRLRKDFNYALEYIDLLEKKIATEPVIEKNWEHLKNFTNQLLDRILELEKRMDNMPVTLPYSPYTPLQPVCPPSIPEWPAWPPYGPIISYALPGGVNVTTTASNLMSKHEGTAK